MTECKNNEILSAAHVLSMLMQNLDNYLDLHIWIITDAQLKNLS